MFMILNHLCYLIFGGLITVVVGRTLFHHGRLFLIDIFAGNERTADAVNRLLLTGYIATNIALVALGIRFGDRPETATELLETLSFKIGWVLLILGAMHYFNIAVLFAVRWPRETKQTVQSLTCQSGQNVLR